MSAMITRIVRCFFVSTNPLILCACLWLLFPLPTMCQDIGFVAVLKGQQFHQTSADIVSLGDWRTWHDTGEVLHEGEHPQPPHQFQVFVLGTAMDSIVSGTVTIPGGEVVDLQPDFLDDPNLYETGKVECHETSLDLHTVRPDGSYTVQLVTQNEGTYSTSLELTGSNYPSVPHITNSTALQTANAASSTTVQWQAMDGGTTSDFIHVKVSQVGGMDDGTIAWQSGMPGQAGALNGLSTQAVIPANTLARGTDYLAEVSFVKTVFALPGPPLAIAGYYKLTGVRIRTVAPSGTPLGAEFLRAIPQDSWNAPAVNSAVSFQFSRPMSPGYHSVSWTKDGGPLVPGTFNYQWIQGNTVLLCEYSSNLPTNSEIGWSLDLSGFHDVRGFPLYGTASGSFHTSADGTPGTPDVEFITIFKTRSFRQTGATPVADGRYDALFEMDATAANRVKSATVTSTANGRVATFYVDPWNGTEYEVPGEYASKNDLDRFYPNGSYQITLDTLADGPQSVAVNLGSTDQYPDAPTITNLASLQALDPQQVCTITWNALPGWTNDFEALEPGAGLIELEIIDDNGWDVFWLEPSDMTDGVSCVIPAGTLQPGRSYQAQVFFIRIVDVQVTEADSIAVGVFESQTAFTIKTSGQPGLPAVELQRVGPAARITTSGGEPFFPYVVQASSDLSRWTLLEVFWNQEQGSMHQFDDSDAHYFKSRFYRVGEYDFSFPMQPPVSIQGTVWTNSSLSTPVPGAMVGTSLDGRTTTTDSQGRFFLITDTPSMGGSTSYTITITSGASPRHFGPWDWGDQPRDQVFTLN